MKNIITNRQARFKYELLDTWETGIQLTGSEVKSMRDGKANFKDGYVVVREGEVWLEGMHIAHYPPAATQNHDPDRTRKLLMHRHEIERLIGKTQTTGLTVVPTKAYFKNGRIKIEIALAKGKQQHDKRQAIKKRETKREIDRELKERHR